MKLKPIKEQAVVIVGASSGIGRAAALAFASRRAAVAAAARDEQALASLEEAMKGLGAGCFTRVVDTADFGQLKALGEQAVNEFGRVDTWVHAPAVGLYARFTETPPEEFKRVIEVNLLGQAYGAMAAVPLLRRAGGGALIQISSIEAHVATPFQSAYTASKHGMRGYLDVLRMELQREGAPVSVTNIMPSGINTPFFAHARTRLGVKPMPLPPAYSPELVARAILYAAEHPVAELVVGGAGKTLVALKRLFPRAADRLMGRVGFRGQRTEQRKSASDPDGFDQPMRGDERIYGDHDRVTRRSSAQLWLATHPRARRTATAAGVVAAGLFAQRLARRRR